MNSARLLVIGTRGFIGSNLANTAAAAGFHVFDGQALDGQAIDITSSESVRSGFEASRPEIVVMLAAISDIDRCEHSPELAAGVNVTGAINVARECALRGARLIFTSSGAVFDGTREGYREGDPTSPISVYGRTKAEAESALAEILPSTIVLRLPLVLGYSPNSHANSLLNKLRDAFRAGRRVRASINEYRNAIDIATLNQFILKLAVMPDCGGLFHAGSDHALSRYEITRALAEKMGFDPALVEAETIPPPGRAPRGMHHHLIADKISEACAMPIPTSEAVLERCLFATT
jgi:dTDP-4-dehydrorhamnose reductase